MAYIANTLRKTGLNTGAAAIAALGGTTALKSLGVSAVRHVGGKWIATKASLYVAGTIGAPATAVAVAPMLGIALTVASVAMLAVSMAPIVPNL